MSGKALGPGVRVYIGYCPDHLCGPGAAMTARCNTGIVLDGPYPGGLQYRGPDGRLCQTLERSWHVDGVGGTVMVAEALLFPIDDDDHDETVEESREVEA